MNKKELEMLDFMSVSLSYWLPEKMMMNITVVIVAADGRFVFMLNWRYDIHIQIYSYTISNFEISSYQRIIDNIK